MEQRRMQQSAQPSARRTDRRGTKWQYRVRSAADALRQRTASAAIASAGTLATLVAVVEAGRKWH